jgi:hypothetical protein
MLGTLGIHNPSTECQARYRALLAVITYPGWLTLPPYTELAIIFSIIDRVLILFSDQYSPDLAHICFVFPLARWESCSFSEAC